MENYPEILSVQQTCELLGVVKSTLYSLDVPYVPLIRDGKTRGRRVYLKSDLIAYLQKARVTPPSFKEAVNG